MTFAFKIRRPLLAALLALIPAVQAQAHAPVVTNTKLIPAHHALIALHALSGRTVIAPTNFNKLTTELLYQRIPGYSGATSTLFTQTKQAAGTGILNGIYAKLNSGQVGSGQVAGTFYQQFIGSTSNATFPNVVIALGANPLNVTTPPLTIPATTISAFSLIKATSGKVAILPVHAVEKLTSKLATTNPVELATYNGLRLGQNIASTGLTGGFLTGTWYDGSGFHSGVGYAIGAFAFGNNPFNQSTIAITYPLSVNNLPSYLTFWNKINVKLSSAQIAGNLYYNNAFDSSSPFLLASGANPLNTKAATILSQSLLQYASYFRH